MGSWQVFQPLTLRQEQKFNSKEGGEAEAEEGDEEQQEYNSKEEAIARKAPRTCNKLSLQSLHTCPVCREQCGSLKPLRRHFKNARDDAHRDGFCRLPKSQQRILQGGSFECSCGAIFSKQKKLTRHLARTYPRHSYVEVNLCEVVVFRGRNEQEPEGLSQQRILIHIGY